MKEIIILIAGVIIGLMIPVYNTALAAFLRRYEISLKNQIIKDKILQQAFLTGELKRAEERINKYMEGKELE